MRISLLFLKQPRSFLFVYIIILQSKRKFCSLVKEKKIKPQFILRFVHTISHTSHRIQDPVLCVYIHYIEYRSTLICNYVKLCSMIISYKNDNCNMFFKISVSSFIVIAVFKLFCQHLRNHWINHVLWTEHQIACIFSSNCTQNLWNTSVFLQIFRAICLKIWRRNFGARFNQCLLKFILQNH